MGYSFNGILSDDEHKLPFPEDSSFLVVRTVDHPTLKMGAIFPDLEIGFNGLHAETNRRLSSISEFGLLNGVLIEYHTWAGTIDSLRIAQVAESHIAKNTYKEFEEITYQKLSSVLSEYQIVTKDIEEFGPFSRGFWGEYGE